MAGPVTILGIESSCDETAAAVVIDGHLVGSSIVATQHKLHAEFAGVVPEIASRAHLERIVPVIRKALDQGNIQYGDLGGVAAGHRPGLIGSLLVGVSVAKAMSWSLGIPLIGVDHVVAHLHAAALDAEPIRFPALGLVASGGHTSLFHMSAPTRLELLGRTIDDAIGEAFDKAATILGLAYPGGPAIDNLARKGNPRAHDLPVSRLDRESLDFSFSGLKTALLYRVRGTPTKRDGHTIFERSGEALSETQRADFAASFQRAAVAAVMMKLGRAHDRQDGVCSLVVGGGVTANSHLRAELTTFARDRGLELRLPEPSYCVDNAAMIAGLGFHHLLAGETSDLTLSPAPNSVSGHATG